MSDLPAQISAAYLRGLTDYLTEKGIDRSHFLAKFGVQVSLLENFQARLPVRIFHEMLAYASASTGDERIGLHVGEQIKPGQYGVLGMSILNCRNLEQAIQRHVRYENLVCNVGHSSYHIDGDEVHLVWENCHQQISAFIAEENVASWVTFARWISGTDLAPICIRFQHQAPEDLSEYQRVFACPVEFGCAQIEVVFPQHYIHLPLRQHDPAMLAMLDDYADRLLLRLNSQDEITEQVKAVISDLLQAGDVSLGAVAEHLDLSERQLQRKLQDADASYQSLLDSTRKTLALRHIENPEMDFAEMTFLLGFSDQSAFARAFKKWTGDTPGQYRKSNLAMSVSMTGNTL